MAVVTSQAGPPSFTLLPSCCQACLCLQLSTGAPWTPGTHLHSRAPTPHHTALPHVTRLQNTILKTTFPLVFPKKQSWEIISSPRTVWRHVISRTEVGNQKEGKLTRRYVLDCSPLWTWVQSYWDTWTVVSQNCRNRRRFLHRLTLQLSIVIQQAWVPHTAGFAPEFSCDPRSHYLDQCHEVFPCVFIRNCTDSGLILKSLIHFWVDLCLWY